MNERESATSETIGLQRLHRRRMAFFGLVILAAGIVIGGASMRLFVRPSSPPIGIPPGTRAERMVEMLDRFLHLSGEQREKLSPVLKGHFQKLEEIREAVWPQITEELRLMNQGISSVLDEQQKRRWEEHGGQFPWQFRPGSRHRRRGPEESGAGPRRSPDDRPRPPYRRGGEGPPSPDDRRRPQRFRGGERPRSPNDMPGPFGPQDDERSPLPGDMPAPFGPQDDERPPLPGDMPAPPEPEMD